MSDKAEGLVHPEVQMALMTQRPELLKALRARLREGGPAVYTEDVAMLLNALGNAIDDAFESHRRLGEVQRVLVNHARSLRGLRDQTERVMRVMEQGGTYQSWEERDREE